MTFDPSWFSSFMNPATSSSMAGSYAHPLIGAMGSGGMGGGDLSSVIGGMPWQQMGGMGGGMGGAGGANPLALAQMGMGLMGQSKQQKPPPLLPAANIGSPVGQMQQVPQGNYFQNAMAQRMGPEVMNYGGLNRMRGVLG